MGFFSRKNTELRSVLDEYLPELVKTKRHLSDNASDLAEAIANIVREVIYIGDYSVSLYSLLKDPSQAIKTMETSYTEKQQTRMIESMRAQINKWRATPASAV